jgi:uncharacterized protein (DUF1330 family)
MSAIRPNPEQFKQIAQSSAEGTVVMLNLLKFKGRSAEGDDSGASEYRRYGDAAIKMIEAQGGRLLWAGRADQILIGDPAEDWDQVLLVEYPSRKAFLEMVAKPEYNEAHKHRESGLERTIVIACTPVGGAMAEGAAP